MPQDCGRATPRAKVVATAASIALPPALSTSKPASAAAGDSEATTPPPLRTAFLYCEPSSASASPTATASSSSVSVVATRARCIIPTFPEFDRDKYYLALALWSKAWAREPAPDRGRITSKGILGAFAVLRKPICSSKMVRRQVSSYLHGERSN